MSGEAGFRIASKLFSLVILSGQPVWSPGEAAPIEERLRKKFAALVPAVEQAVEAARAELSLTEFAASGAAPEGSRLLHVGVRVPSGEGANLVLAATAPALPARLRALAARVAKIFWPDDEPIIR